MAPTLMVSGLLLACAASESPFELWDMRVGMPLAELDSIFLHDQLVRFTCMSGVAGHRRCAVPLRGSSGRIEAVVDTADRVVELTYFTGVGVTPWDRREVEDMVAATRGVAEAWSRVVEPETTAALEGRTDTWRVGRGRWTARIHWDATHRPVVIAIADQRAAGPYREAAARAAAEAKGRASSGGTAGEAEPARLELRRLAVAQRAYRGRNGTYARDLGALHFVPPAGVVVEVGGARASGWWATARTAGGRECVLWEGVPPPPGWGRELGGIAGRPDCR